jgi:hypothetical protein
MLPEGVVAIHRLALDGRFSLSFRRPILLIPHLVWKTWLVLMLYLPRRKRGTSNVWLTSCLSPGPYRVHDRQLCMIAHGTASRKPNLAGSCARFASQTAVSVESFIAFYARIVAVKKVRVPASRCHASTTM